MSDPHATEKVEAYPTRRSGLIGLAGGIALTLIGLEMMEVFGEFDFMHLPDSFDPVFWVIGLVGVVLFGPMTVVVAYRLVSPQGPSVVLSSDGLYATTHRTGVNQVPWTAVTGAQAVEEPERGNIRVDVAYSPETADHPGGGETKPLRRVILIPARSLNVTRDQLLADIERFRATYGHL